jgi:hypothetical protein
MGLFGEKAQPAYDHERARLARNLDEAEVRHLEVLRREIANLIVIVDPDLITRCYDKAWSFERESAENPVRAQAEEAALVAKVPMFSDFDLIGTRHFVPYDVARDRISDDELVERYLEISRMLVFMRCGDEVKPEYSVHDEKERKVLEHQMQAKKDRQFRKRIEDAIIRFNAYRTRLEKGDPSSLGVTNFEDPEVEVIRLPSLPDIQYGIAFKKTGEHGAYEFYVHDDGKITRSYFRSNASFKERKALLR